MIVNDLPIEKDLKELLNDQNKMTNHSQKF